jgi:hypothetical protein
MSRLKKPDTQIKNLLKTAKDNLKLADCAFDKENYPDTISLLSQAIEKGSKSFFSYFDIVPVENLSKTVGHFPTKGFEKALENIDAQFNVVTKNLSQINWKEEKESPIFDIRTIQHDKKTLMANFSFISNNPSRFKSISKRNMDKLISTVKNLQLELQVSRQNIFSERGYLTDFHDFQKDVFSILDHQKMKKEQVQMFKFSSTVFYEVLDDKCEINDKAILFHNIVNLTVSLSVLSIITQAHAVSSRYPPIGVYSKNNLLIKEFPTMKILTENALNDLDEIFTISEKYGN